MRPCYILEYEKSGEYFILFEILFGMERCSTVMIYTEWKIVNVGVHGKLIHSQL